MIFQTRSSRKPFSNTL
ncbi:hypothetical protein [Ruminococcus sp. AM42-11]